MWLGLSWNPDAVWRVVMEASRDATCAGVEARSHVLANKTPADADLHARSALKPLKSPSLRDSPAQTHGAGNARTFKVLTIQSDPCYSKLSIVTFRAAH
jgi:hypothetical protein